MLKSLKMLLKMVLMVMWFFKYTESKCVTIITKMGIAQFTKINGFIVPCPPVEHPVCSSERAVWYNTASRNPPGTEEGERCVQLRPDS